MRYRPFAETSVFFRLPSAAAQRVHLLSDVNSAHNKVQLAWVHYVPHFESLKTGAAAWSCPTCLTHPHVAVNVKWHQPLTRMIMAIFT